MVALKIFFLLLLLFVLLTACLLSISQAIKLAYGEYKKEEEEKQWKYALYYLGGGVFAGALIVLFVQIGIF